MAKKYIDAELIKSTRSLYFDIDTCITELIRARTEQNEENEGKALFRMEGLMVATLQQLNCIIDSLQQAQSCDTCTNDKGCVTCEDGELWEGKEQPCEDLEKYASRAGFDYVDDIESKFPGHRWNDHDVEFGYRDGFIAGAEWARKQMLKEAVEATVKRPEGYYQGYIEVIKFVDESLQHGDKVKVIIVPDKEDEK